MLKIKALRGFLFMSLLILAYAPAALAQGSRPIAPEGEFGETYYAPFPVQIKLDGSFNDWDAVPQVTLSQGVGRPAVTFAAAADAEYLYLFADVIDDNIISGEHGADYWNEDSVEFYLNGTGDLTLTSYRDGVAQLTFPPINAALEDHAEAVIAGVRGETMEAQVFTTLTDRGWAVEVAVPLENSVWSITPTHEGQLGFQVHLNGASTLNRDTKLSWSNRDNGDQSHQNPSVFATLIFHEVSNEPIVTGEYFFASSLADDGSIDDFENGIWLGRTADDAPLGLAPVDVDSSLAIQQVLSDASAARVGQNAPAENVLAVQGSFNHHFTDGYGPTPQDWQAYNALGFWVYTAEAATVTVNIATQDATSSAEISTESGWQHVILPFKQFEPSITAEQLATVSAYGTGGDQTHWLDNVRLYELENEHAALISDEAPAFSFVLDESVTWESRNWALIWSDEFDAEADAPVNPENWLCEEGGHGWGNQELQYYTQRLENVSHTGEGQLAIRAIQGQPDDNGTCWYGRCAYTSARCITKDRVEFTYGRVEARLQIPRGQGMWPAFWMLGANFPEVNWPDSGEIDIMENVGNDPFMVHGTIHGPGYSGASGMGYHHAGTEAFADDFHSYAIEWGPGVIRWYVDGTLFNTLSRNDLRNREWAFDHDFFMIMNVAVGGTWPGYPNENTEFPQQMLVDYIRVYQLDEAPE